MSFFMVNTVERTSRTTAGFVDNKVFIIAAHH